MNTKTTLGSLLLFTFIAVGVSGGAVGCAAPVEGSVEQADRASERGAEPASSSSAEPSGDELLGAEQVAVPANRGPRPAAAATSQPPRAQ